MEEVIALVIQFLLEVVLQLFGGLGLDFATSSSRRGDRDGCGCSWLPLFAVLGGVCGGLSLIFAPNAILPTPALRFANLIAAPLIAGGLSYLTARYLRTRENGEPTEHFWNGFWFALAYGLVRFAYIHK